MGKRLIIGNWKMNPASLRDAKRIARRTRQVAAELGRTEVAACPPFVFIQACSPRRTSANWSMGAQSVSVHTSGAHTGGVSADMLRDIGVEYVIAGHSEEREAGLTDAMVSARISQITGAGMTAVLCVGEKTRDDNGSYLDTLKEQIKGSLQDVPKNKAKDVIVAYEPVWAIGGTEAMNPEQIREMSIFVRKVIADIFGQESAMKTKVLYGGSVNFRNAGEIITVGQVDGLLVGRESVNMPGYIDLIRAVDAIDPRS